MATVESAGVKQKYFRTLEELITLAAIRKRFVHSDFSLTIAESNLRFKTNGFGSSISMLSVNKTLPGEEKRVLQF